MKYSSVIFDWDGTIGMTLHLWLESYRTVLKELGLQYSDEIIVKDFFYEHKKAALKYPGIDFKQLSLRVHEYMVNHAPTLKVYAGAKEMLENLKNNNITLVLVSSSSRKLLTEGLQGTGLQNFFSVIVAGDEVQKHKPDPEPFQQIMAAAKISPKDTIVLGDSLTDILAAQAAGIDSCAFLPTENEIFRNTKKIKNSNPTYSVTSLKEFVDIILAPHN